MPRPPRQRQRRPRQFIFVADIDETLRDNEQDAPVPHSRAVLRDVERKGVPIVYLTAAPASVRAMNRRFLQRFPRGWLIDRRTNDRRTNGRYKEAMLVAIQRARPVVCV